MNANESERFESDESGRSLDDYVNLGGLGIDEDEDEPECNAKHCSQNAEYLIKETEKCKLPFRDTTVRCSRHAKRNKKRGYEVLAFDGYENLNTDPWRSD